MVFEVTILEDDIAGILMILTVRVILSPIIKYVNI